MIAAALGAAVGVVLVPVLFAIMTAAAPMPALAGFTFGLWSMAALVPLAVLRRGGTGVIGAVAAGVVTMVSPAGPAMLMMMAMFGLLIELPFLVTRYRWFGLKMLLVSGVVLGALSCLLSVFTYDLPNMQPLLLTLVCAGQLVSAAAGGALSWLIARALRRAGIGGASAQGANA
ncbi:ECF transporter S component [Microbacterium marinilacus]|nr:ECF transporter S component [Microbacterium marinilacus]MBY0690469.1 ECF transporter S component [Microbacterium marinilacus]